MYVQNNRGPRMEAWGTPQVRGATEEEVSPMTIEKDSSQSSSVLDANPLFKATQ